MLGTYKQIIFTTFTNVGSNQIQLIRKILRASNSHLVISKNVYYLPSRPSSRKSSEWEPRASRRKSSHTLKSNMEEKSLNSSASSHSLNKKSPSSSLKLQSMTSRDKSKPTKFPLKPELVPFHLLISPFLQDPLDLTHLKSTSSTPSTSQPRLSRDKLKSPKNSRCVQLERKSRPQKQLFSRNSTSSPSLTVWKWSPFMMKDQSCLKKFWTLTQPLFSANSKLELKTLLAFLWKLDIQLLPLSLLWSAMPSRTLPLCPSNQGIFIDNSVLRSQKSTTWQAVLQLLLKKPPKKKKRRKHQRRKLLPLLLLRKKKTWIWETCSADRI